MAKRGFIKNEDIEDLNVILIDENGNKLGKIKTSEALDLAYDKGLDLVKVQNSSDKIPFSICKLLDLSKQNYNKKRKSGHKHRTKNKEMRFNVNIADHDLEIKAKHIQEILEKGDRVKIVLKNNRRFGSNQDIMQIVFDKILNAINYEFNKDKLDQSSKVWSMSISP